MADLFGGDGGPLEKAKEETYPGEQEDGKNSECEAKVMEEKNERNLSSTVPDDPFDIHQQDEQKRKAPVWIDEDDYNIR